MMHGNKAARGVVLCFRCGSVQSHLCLSPIGAQTLKMPVPYPPPSVEGYTQTPTHHNLCWTLRAQITSLTSEDLVVPRLSARGCHDERWERLVCPHQQEVLDDQLVMTSLVPSIVDSSVALECHVCCPPPFPFLID